MNRTRGLIREQDLEKVRDNRRRQKPVQGTEREIDFQPVCRLYVPFTGCVWLLTELDGEDVAFGLCDLGGQCPELGSVWLPDLEELDVRGLRVLQDVSWRADKTISQYATIASREGRIIS